MKYKLTLTFSLLSLLTFVTACSPPEPAKAPVATQQNRPYHKIFKVKGTFSEIRDFLIFSLQDHGLKVNNVSHIGDMLERTGKDLGRTTKVYEHAEGIEFCSSTLSRNMMEADRDNIVFCPYIIYIYVKPSDPGMVYLSYRIPNQQGSPAVNKTLQDVQDLIEDIIKGAMS
jgi:uncharacterized protein (DUF302 family)